MEIVNACGTCKIKRKYKGIICPLRLLCDCESHRCSKCKAFAVCVEFNKPIKEYEPLLTNKSHSSLYCEDHAPKGWQSLEEPKTEVKKESSKNILLEDKVECAACKHTHTMANRINWNGTYSYCPKCKKEDIYTHGY